MKYSITTVLTIFSILFIGCQNKSTSTNQPLNKDLVIAAHNKIKEYNLGKDTANNIVKVVYFHGNDIEPFPNWEERLTRTLADVSDYYKESFNKYGVDIDGIPFEKNNGKYLINVIQGYSESRHYTPKSGTDIQVEIFKRTNGEIDCSRDHVLILNALCYQRPDKTYVFHSPYHGMGTSANGVCHVAECELLDSKLLTDTETKMVFSEPSIALKHCFVAEFNSWYIGGIAHELGHEFCLPHDFGQPGEFDSKGISLMGNLGSRHFRDYLWNGEKSASFSAASILQLISNPIFSKAVKARNKEIDFQLERVTFGKNEKGTIVKPVISAKELPYAVVALVRPSHKSDYHNMSFSAIVNSEETSIEIDKLPRGKYFLQLSFLYPDGTFRRLNLMMNIDNEGNAKLLEQTGVGEVNVRDLYSKYLKSEKTPEVQTILEILTDILTPPELLNLTTCNNRSVNISDSKWESASVGWDNIARNYFSKESEFKLFLKLQGKIYNKGLYAHSPSSYVFNLDGKWKTFSSTIGIRDGAHTEGSAIFKVLGDGKLLFESSILRVNQKDELKIDVSNIKVLELQTAGGEGHANNSWAIWVDPVLKR